MVNELINRILCQVKEQYPQIECPAAMKAKIMAAFDKDEIEKECIIVEKSTGIEHECFIKTKTYLYTVRILNNDGVSDKAYPEIPDVHSREAYPIGETVTVVFTGGGLNPSIVGG